jgi:hypothetical protein
MLWFNKSKSAQEEEIKKLEQQLKIFIKPKLSVEKRLQMRENLLARIESGSEVEFVPSVLQRLADSVTDIGRKVRLKVHSAAIMKDRIFAAIEDRNSLAVNNLQIRSGNRFRTVLSSVLLVIFVVSSLIVFPFQNSVTLARSTYLSEVQGDVYVLRDGDLLKGKEYQTLKEGDVILTKGKSYVTVKFFDDSVSRLNENTNLQIRRLYAEPLNPVVTQIVLYLKEGNIWSRVVNLVDEESSFVVDTSKVQATVNSKASFDFSTMDSGTSLTVFDNVVDMAPVNEKESDRKTVIAGYKAVYNNEETGGPVLESVKDAASGQENKTWVEVNLSLDQAYDKEIVATKEKLIKSEDNNSVLETSAAGIGKTDVVLTDPEMEKERQDFIAAYHELIKGENLLVRGLHKDGIRALGQFHKTVKQILEKMPEFEARDPFNADLLKSQVREKISVQLKDLAVFMPGQRLYVAKDILQQIELTMAQSELDKAEVRLSQAQGNLLEIQELLKDGRKDLAMVMIKNYRSQMEQFVVKISKENLNELQDNLVPLVKQQVEQIKVLTAIEQSVKGEEMTAMFNEVNTVRHDSLKKLVDALDQLPDAVPTDVLNELKEVFDSYLADNADDADLISPTLDKLVSGKFQVKFIAPEDGTLLEEIGVVTIITEEEATPNVTIDTTNNVNDAAVLTEVVSDSLSGQQSQN